MHLLLPLALLACGPTTATASTATPVLADMDGEARWNWMRDNASNAAQGLDQIAASLAALPADQRAVLAQRAAFVLDDCPYNRSALQLFHTLELLVPDHPDLAGVRAAVAGHRAVMAQLGVTDLPTPTLGGYIGQHADQAHALSRADLEAAVDPIAATEQTLSSVMPLVQEMPEATFERLEAARADLADPLADQWPFKSVTFAIQADLDAVVASTTDPGLKAQAAGLSRLITSFTSLMC